MSTLGGSIYMNCELMSYTNCYETLHIESRMTLELFSYLFHSCNKL